VQFNHAKKIEIVLILIVGLGFLLAGRILPHETGLGNILIGASALLLLQSLVRDLWLLIRQRRSPQQATGRVARCMCVESTLGATGVFAGTILLGTGIDRVVVMSNWAWSVLALAVMILGLAMKDYVFEWSPWKLYQDKDHLNIVFKSRK